MKNERFGAQKVQTLEQRSGSLFIYCAYGISPKAEASRDALAPILFPPEFGMNKSLFSTKNSFFYLL